MTIDKSSIWETRTEERPYAFLSDQEIKDENRYGQKIDLREINPDWDAGQSMYINGNPEVGSNPNRNKQHGFFFTADNCIGCHACEAACSEKNENPGHIAFRSVGYVEGGTYPDYKRMNISMACNHCDDPVCLKGCPTNAYTKHTEYGAVLQDPETCFGCGYCTWVCPYNAPQLDPVKGQVSKCNMCVDRLEVGLKPACVSACLGNALDFGVIENIPENREEAKTSIPGFPNPDITHPNIRFQQTKGMPEEVSRTDSMPVKYHKNAEGQYKPRTDQKDGLEKHWNLNRLSSRENPLVMFTLLSQMSIGAFAITFLGSMAGIASLDIFRASAVYAPLAIICFALISFGMFMSTTHLGKPMRFYRGFNNLKFSPVCREGLGIAIFIAMLGLHIVFSLPTNTLFQDIYTSLFGANLNTLISATTATAIANVFGFLAIAGGAGALFYMYRCYRIKARPFWDHWQTATDFAGNTLALGGLLAGIFATATLALNNVNYAQMLSIAGGAIVFGLALQALGLKAHARAMSGQEHEGAASHYIQRTTFGKTYILRNSLIMLNLLAGIILLVSSQANDLGLLAWCGVGAVLLISSSIGRALFYVLVVPTTMPGAFFWKNKGFEQHARDIGLANMPQVGVVASDH
ncbi:dimethyl sulfoxide reductase anchor subunit [Gammaproteobacteria bacterium]|nr:dimethyl sulfoxide reductase anchor subunit [Gammaproteobacteria bacterium]